MVPAKMQHWNWIRIWVGLGNQSMMDQEPDLDMQWHQFGEPIKYYYSVVKKMKV